MSAPTVLITGCSSGIGEATANYFADNSWTVYATARDTTTLQDLWNAGCTTKELDVTKHEDIYRVLNTIEADEGRLDALINNAGYGQFGPMEDIPVSRLREQFDVNLFGVHRLTREALPLLRESNGTIVNLSSIVGAVWAPGTGAYSASKAALEAMSDALRVELSPHGVDVVLIEPGPVTTEFDSRRTDSMQALSQTGLYNRIYQFHAGNDASNRLPPSSPDDVATQIYQSATADSPPARVPVGKRTSTVMWFARTAPTRLRDWVFNRMLSD